MRRILSVLLVLAVLIGCTGCDRTSVDAHGEVILRLCNEEKDICMALSGDEAQKVISILDGKRYASSLSGVPACGFDPDISLQIGDQVYAIARDTCGILQDMTKARFFSVPEEDMAYIHTLFESYGGYFPCV